ncbi:MAG: tRNA epoxyqueuosine(34) reductase QueG [Burkholderiaceae bacterium]|jgi:epoxyqueuosine reductase
MQLPALASDKAHPNRHDWAAWMRAQGFEHWGVTDIDLHDAEEGLLQWLGAGFHGEMDYMARHGLKRARPAALVPGTVSVLMVALSYRPRASAWVDQAWGELERNSQANVSLYARGRDYHKLLRSRLQALGQSLKQHLPGLEFRAFCDSAPVMEVELAHRAKLGWRGKNTLLLNRQSGSMFFLGSLFLNRAIEQLPMALAGEIEAHQADPSSDRCGSCSACLDVCPTKAIVAPYRLDARRCISYLTIEHPGPIPVAFRAAMGNRIYGCDDCQLICPWNKFAVATPVEDFKTRPAFLNLSLTEALSWSEERFLQNTEGMAIRRIGHWRWQRNVVVALGNLLASGSAQEPLEDGKLHARQALIALRSQADPVLAEHIDWALNR